MTKKFNDSKKRLLTAGVSLLVVFCLFFGMGLTESTLPFGLVTADSKAIVFSDPLETDSLHKTKVQVPDSLKLLVELRDSTLFVHAMIAPPPYTYCPKDTSIKDIMLFGDSQVEFLRLSVYNYCIKNNYNLVASIVWYGSTTVSWGTSDKLENYIKQYNPDFIICALGLNEILTSNVEPRRKHIQTIKNTFERNHVPYYWIGPAAWTEDGGICEVMHQELDTLFYPSHLLTLERASDKRHPSFSATKVLFDSAASAMNLYTPISFPNKVVEYDKPKASPFVLLPVPSK